MLIMRLRLPCLCWTEIAEAQQILLAKGHWTQISVRGKIVVIQHKNLRRKWAWVLAICWFPELPSQKLLRMVFVNGVAFLWLLCWWIMLVYIYICGIARLEYNGHSNIMIWYKESSCCTLNTIHKYLGMWWEENFRKESSMRVTESHPPGVWNILKWIFNSHTKQNKNYTIKNIYLWYMEFKQSNECKISYPQGKVERNPATLGDERDILEGKDGQSVSV